MNVPPYRFGHTGVVVGQAGSEIERKFVPDSMPSTDGWAPPVALRQGYLAEEGDVTVRVRFAGRQARLTVKAGDGVHRVELEVPVDPFVADRLWPSTEGRRVTKRRYEVPLGDDHAGLTAEVDFYEGALEGLCTVEVEFDSLAAAEAFQPPAWFGREVTDRAAWTNASLARNGRPPPGE
jgi:adenylate cyclase